MIIEFLKSEDVKNSSLFSLINNSNSSGFQSIQGVTQLSLIDGQAIFSPEKLFSHPNTEVFLKVTSPLILRYYSELFPGNKTLSDFNLKGSYAFVFSIKLRECIVGEVFLSQINRSISIFFLILKLLILFSCNQCPIGKYSLVDPYKSTICQSCPSNAICVGGANMSISSGFWRESNQSDVVLDCLQFSQFCLFIKIILCISSGN